MIENFCRDVSTNVCRDVSNNLCCDMSKNACCDVLNNFCRDVSTHFCRDVSTNFYRDTYGPPYISDNVRVSKERFDHLYSLLEERIGKRDTRFGSSQQPLSYSCRLRCMTVSNIIKDVCDAMYDVLSPM